MKYGAKRRAYESEADRVDERRSRASERPREQRDSVLEAPAADHVRAIDETSSTVLPDRRALPYRGARAGHRAPVGSRPHHPVAHLRRDRAPGDGPREEVD